MTGRGLQTAAAALILLALALLVGGLQADQPLLWGSGLAAVGVAMVLSLLTRWASAGTGAS